MTPILELIFMTLTENSSVITNDTQGPQISTQLKLALGTHVLGVPPPSSHVCDFYAYIGLYCKVSTQISAQKVFPVLRF